MSKSSLPIKPTELILCGYCISIKNRSRKFKSPYALEYHIATIHKDDLATITPTEPNLQVEVRG